MLFLDALPAPCYLAQYSSRRTSATMQARAWHYKSLSTHLSFCSGKIFSNGRHRKNIVSSPNIALHTFQTRVTFAFLPITHLKTLQLSVHRLILCMWALAGVLRPHFIRMLSGEVQPWHQQGTRFPEAAGALWHGDTSTSGGTSPNLGLLLWLLPPSSWEGTGSLGNSSICWRSTN